MLYKSLEFSDRKKIVEYINEKEEMDPGIRIAVFLVQSRKLLIIPEHNGQTQERISKRPFSLVGVYGSGVTEDMLDEDMVFTIKVYDAHMEMRRLLARSGKRHRCFESVYNLDQAMYA